MDRARLSREAAERRPRSGELALPARDPEAGRGTLLGSSRGRPKNQSMVMAVLSQALLVGIVEFT